MLMLPQTRSQKHIYPKTQVLIIQTYHTNMLGDLKSEKYTYSTKHTAKPLTGTH